jgi:NADPH-dependent 2,4-dienoyl-CoA reductase/sulfur reductase-like enzyme
VSLRLVIVGGSDAGIEAARRSRYLDPTVDVTVLVADAYPNFSVCGLPYYLAGDVRDWRALAHRTRGELEATGMRLLLEHRATALDAETKRLKVRRPDGTAEMCSTTGSFSPRAPGRFARRSTASHSTACTFCTR